MCGLSSAQSQTRKAAIIPLGPGSLRDSSSLPEGRSRHARTRAYRHTGRASPPLLFGLAPRGVFRASDVAIGAVGSYPTFSPLPNALDRKRRALGVTSGLPQRPSPIGGLFSVALSVAAPQTRFRSLAAQPPGVTRRVALYRSGAPVERSKGLPLMLLGESKGYPGSSPSHGYSIR